MSSWSWPIIEPSLRLEDADHPERDVLDPDRLADRVLVAEEVRRHGLPEDADLRGDRLSWSVKNCPAATFQERMSGQSTSPPWIDVDQFWLP